ncbi:MAG: site-2 protease family protein [bacterium]
MLDNLDILFYLLFIPNMLFALSIHEFSHAGSAYVLGDDTAALEGRVSLNPLVHIDPLGLIAFFIIHFGWAKPVPVNPSRMGNPRRDNLLVSLAGPGSNLVLGVLLLLVARMLLGGADPTGKTMKMVLGLVFIGAQLNIGLCFFNLIPIPPLDGGHILEALLPPELGRKLEPYLQYGPYIFIGLIFASVFLGWRIFAYIIILPMYLVMEAVLGNQALGFLIRNLDQFQI